MASGIFINYRRGDDPGFTHALYLRLEAEFSPSGLFMDVEGHIKPGDDFLEVLSNQIARADVVLVVIGPRWADLLAGRQRDLDDFVVIEIKAALDQGKRVIPVLVGGASMPRADTLPEAIRALARRNAVVLRPDRFKADCQGLVTALREQLATPWREPQWRVEAAEEALNATETTALSALPFEFKSFPTMGNLRESLSRAYRLASEQSHAAVTPEHLLLALIQDDDAVIVLKYANIDMAELSSDLSSHLRKLPKSDTEPLPSPDLLRIMEAARRAAMQAGRPGAEGSIVLAAIIGDGLSLAARMLATHGLNFETAIRALQKASRVRTAR